eukprot:CAMPEP_0113610692 /NCGR_PEP_ID=MMETSP0017_2-20120614/5159_1 /TAXON_ID=2856 /ORGANISM="Cylindrotheca closterium" /LENGTH=721 /DNA_ID=CAMNT_0000519591 /DNA_START=680 /DNA_END=2845 /DNA_ORIENTATION=- /assembly_acc=CAM_ASM_000147
MKSTRKLIVFILLLSSTASARKPTANRVKNTPHAYLRKATRRNKKRVTKISTTTVNRKKLSRFETRKLKSTEIWQSLGLKDDGVAYGNVGWSLSLSSDGHTVAVATQYKANWNTFGHVDVFGWNGTAWNRVGKRIEGDPLSTVESVSISGDGKRVAIGEPNFNQSAGRARVFTWNGDTWSQMGHSIRIEEGGMVGTGESVSLSSTGNVLAVGAPSTSTLSRNGQVRAYFWNAYDWRPLGQPIEGKHNHDQYGWSLALSADGHVLATGGYNGGDESANAGVYELSDHVWVQMGSEFTAAMTYDSYHMDYLSLSSDGKTFALGEPGDNTKGHYAGRARVFHWQDDNKWTQIGQDIFTESAGNRNSGYLGYSVSLSSQGDSVAVGGPTHGSKHLTVSSGRAVVFKWDGFAWAQIGQDFDGTGDYQHVGWSVALSSDGNTFAIGESSSRDIGHVKVYQIPIAATSVGSQGDLHYKTWKGEHYEYHGQCDIMLIKDDNFANGRGLQVQTRTKNGRFWSFNQAAAIMIGNDTLEIEGIKEAIQGDEGNRYWINGVYQGPLKTLGGFPVKNQIEYHTRRNFIVDLDSVYPGQKIVLSTWKEFVRVDIQNGTHESFGKSVGMLGDFSTGKILARDGSTELDDFLEFGNEWQVLPSEGMLFHKLKEPQFPNKCTLPDNNPRGDRHHRLEKVKVSEKEARDACSEISDEHDFNDCINDTVATQDLDMVTAY